MGRLRSAGLEHSKPHLFVSAQWRCWPDIAYLVYRVAAALFLAVWLCLSGAVKFNWAQHDHDRKKWFIYMTNWSFTVLTLGALLQAVCTFFHILNKKRRRSIPITEKNSDTKVLTYEAETMTWYYKLSWVLYNVSSLSAIVVSVIFWALLYPAYKACPSNQVLSDCGSACTPTCVEPEQECDVSECVTRCQCPEDMPYWHEDQCYELSSCPSVDVNGTTPTPYEHTEVYEVHYISVMIHTGNTVYVLVNLLITAMPMHLLHWLHYGVYGLLYTVFTFIYHLAGGTNAYHQPYVYDVLDWNHPLSTAGSLVMIVVLSVIVWLFLVAATQLRRKVASRVYDTLTPSASSGDEESSGQDLRLMSSYSRQESL